MTNSLERGRLLAAQGRWDMAERELRMAVGENPDSPSAHGLLSLALMSLKRSEEALLEAQTAVRLEPGWPMAHYILAQVLDAMDRLKDAEAAIREAIRLEPDDADYHASLAGLCFQQSRWADSLAAAEEGLRQNPDHINCLNFRGLALTKLGRRAEAGHNMTETLARGPENALSHTVQGWNYLESNRPREALESFRTALRLDPDLDYAKRGMVEALKARNWLYRILLQYFLWMGRLSGRAQWGVVLGLYFGSRLLLAAAKSYPALEPFVLPIIVLYVIFCVLTWIAQPMFNLILRLNRFGRYALSKQQIVASNWFGGFLAAAVVFAVVGLGCGFWPATALAIWFGLMLQPLALSMQAPTKRRPWFLAAAALLGCIGLAGLLLVGLESPSARNILGIFVFGWVGFPWLMNLAGR